MNQNESCSLIITLKNIHELSAIMSALASFSSVASVSFSRDFFADELSLSTDSAEEAETIQTILRKMGVSPNLKGYGYLIDAINYILESKETTVSITKHIYPFIAKKYSSSTAKIERSIRHAIETAWKTGNEDIFEHYLGFMPTKKPTNSQFVTAVAEYIKEHNRKQ